MQNVRANFIHNWKRCLFHIPVGGYNLWLLGKDTVAGIVFAIGFVVLYEINEDWHLRDGAYIDTQGWLIGFFLYSLWLYRG